MNFGDEMIYFEFEKAINDLPEDNSIKKASQQLLDHMKRLSGEADDARREANAATWECAKYIELISIMSAAYNKTLKSLEQRYMYCRDDE